MKIKIIQVLYKRWCQRRKKVFEASYSHISQNLRSYLTSKQVSKHAHQHQALLISEKIEVIIKLLNDSKLNDNLNTPYAFKIYLKKVIKAM